MMLCKRSIVKRQESSVDLNSILFQSDSHKMFDYNRSVVRCSMNFRLLMHPLDVLVISRIAYHQNRTLEGVEIERTP
jgi:hypothetical protein